jgi:DNA mismatch repair ATPase MutL
MSDKVSEVKLKIDYEIIQHFSQHLYGSPNKAVEELVSNSFDAAAQEVRVYIPKTQTKKSVIVWDDGDGMDVNGLQNLVVVHSRERL